MSDPRAQLIAALREVAAKLGYPDVEFDVWWVR